VKTVHGFAEFFMVGKASFVTIGMPHASVEAAQAGAIAGADLDRTEELYDAGFWDGHPLSDPDTALAGGVDIPVGPWGESKWPRVQMKKADQPFSQRRIMERPNSCNTLGN